MSLRETSETGESLRETSEAAESLRETQWPAGGLSARLLKWKVSPRDFRSARKSLSVSQRGGGGMTHSE